MLSVTDLFSQDSDNTIISGCVVWIQTLSKSNLGIRLLMFKWRTPIPFLMAKSAGLAKHCTSGPGLDWTLPERSRSKRIRQRDIDLELAETYWVAWKSVQTNNLSRIHFCRWIQFDDLTKYFQKVWNIGLQSWKWERSLVEQKAGFQSSCLVDLWHT